LKSLIDTECGSAPTSVEKFVLAEKVGVDAPGIVVFKKTETEVESAFVTTISGFPSPLKSPIATDVGWGPVEKSVFAEKVGVALPAGVVFNKTETVFELPFAAAISGFPSPFKSRIATENVPLPVVKSVLVENVACANELIEKTTKIKNRTNTNITIDA